LRTQDMSHYARDNLTTPEIDSVVPQWTIFIAPEGWGVVQCCSRAFRSERSPEGESERRTERPERNGLRAGSVPAAALHDSPPAPPSTSIHRETAKEISRKIRVPSDRVEPIANVSRVDRDVTALFGCAERDLVEDALEHRMESPRADVLGLLVDAHRDLRDLGDRIGGHVEVDAVGAQQRLVLTDQRVLGLGEDDLEVGRGQRVQLDPHRKASLQLRDEIRRLRDVERAGRDEQHVIGRTAPVFGVHGAALDDREDVALHAFARDVGAARAFAAGDLVDLVDEDDPWSPARRSASCLTASMSISLSASCCAKMRRASATVTLFFTRFLGSSPPSISPMSAPPPGSPPPSIPIGSCADSSTSISIMRTS